MGNQAGIRFHLIIASIFLVATTHMCLGAENTTICSEEERSVLLKFKQSIIDEFGMLSTWVGDQCCRWKGVDCDVATGTVVGLGLRGHVIWNSNYFPESYPVDKDSYSTDKDSYSTLGKDSYRLDLDSLDKEDKYLVGDEVMSSLAELSHLKSLDLSGNNFQKAQIPEFIGSYKHLVYLNLSNAGFSGIIPPHLGNLSNLEVLDLSSPKQDLMADDMTWVFGLKFLKHLDLSGVDLGRAQNLYMVFYNIPSLIDVRLSHCSLNSARLGPHLNSSKTLSNIEYLDLSKNFFKDQVPVFLQNMTSLAFLDLSNSDFSMTWNFVNLLIMIPSLSELHLSGCGLHNEHLSPTHLNVSTRSKIQHLDLSLNSIQGRFPSFLTNMKSLRVLNLQHNFINSSIPVMPNLLKLDISSNNFTKIKHVGMWRQCHLKQLILSRNYLGEELIGMSTNISICSHYVLEVLYLDHNQLRGSIPESLRRLTNLRVLDMSSNELTAPIPDALCRLRFLKVLDLSSNSLNGTIPISVGNLKKINFLDVSANNLQGIVSEAHFANLSMLKHLDVSSNKNLALDVSREWIPPFQLKIARLGSCKIPEFPQWLQHQTKLKMLKLSNASISGILPSWLRKMPIIPHIDLSHNNLSGSLTNLPFGYPFNGGFRDEYRGSLLLQNNLFNGSIPWSLCKRAALEVLDLSRNRLTGKIPRCLENLEMLRALILSSNALTGEIPSSIGGNSLLTWLHLNENQFTGELPQDLRNLHDLWILDVGNNELSGKIPEWIAELTELMVLRLHENKFSGRVPSSLCKNPCLQILDVAHNYLNGTIPRCIGELSGMVYDNYCRHYTYSQENMIQVIKGMAYSYSSILGLIVNIDLSSNELVGQIPEDLTKLTGLVGVNLSRNHLSGSIPLNIGNIRELESLDFSENNLSGMIPPSMAKMHFLLSLNLSHNNLTGQIPTSPELQYSDISAYAGNEYLCGPPLPKTCPTTSTNNYQAVDEQKNLWFYWDIMGGFATGFCGVIGVLFFKKQWRYHLYRFAKVTKEARTS